MCVGDRHRIKLILLIIIYYIRCSNIIEKEKYVYNGKLFLIRITAVIEINWPYSKENIQCL